MTSWSSRNCYYVPGTLNTTLIPSNKTPPTSTVTDTTIEETTPKETPRQTEAPTTATPEPIPTGQPQIDTST